MSARLIIRRPKQFADIFRRYRITINGMEAGSLKRGEDLSIDLVAGAYIVQAVIDGAVSDPLMIILRDGETEQLEVGNNYTKLSVFTMMFRRVGYLYLCRAGPYGFDVFPAQ